MADINGYSSILSEAVQDQIFKNTAFPGQASIWCALYTTMPAVDGTGGVEPIGNAYARVEVPVASWGVASTTTEVTSTTNTASITFPEATPSGWGLILGFGLLTAVTAGDLWVGGPLNTPKTIAANTIAVFLPGNLVVNTKNQ
jgi:hypothetical protein